MKLCSCEMEVSPGPQREKSFGKEEIHTANCDTKVFSDINAAKSNSGLTTMKTALETEASFFKNSSYTLI